MKSRVVGRLVSSGTGRISERVSAYGPGRVCGMPGCGTLLSTYNPGHYCSLHDAFFPAQACRRRI